MQETHPITSGHRLSCIVAAGRDMSIGRGGDMPWHLPEDLRHFKAITTGHPVIMGRSTWESLPRRPLPGRLNIVLTRRAGYIAEGALTASSVEEAFALIPPGPEPFVIGGAEIYRQTLHLCSDLYLTRIETETPDADTRFPAIDPGKWSLAESEGPFVSKTGLRYTFLRYENSDRK